jgi:hypothetical protein
MKKCPSGVICIENFSMFFFIICILIIIYFIYNFNKQKIIVNNNPSEKIVVKENNGGFFGGLIPSWPYSNFAPPNDPLLNPYAPPLSDERYLVPTFNGIPPGSIPINVSTNVGAVDTNYRQLGILTTTKKEGRIIPLMGRPLFTNRDKWQYYTISNQNNSIKLPILRNGRSCTNEYGCDRLYSGDIVHVEGLNERYKVTVYDSDTIRYLPF